MAARGDTAHGGFVVPVFGLGQLVFVGLSLFVGLGRDAGTFVRR